MRHTPESFFRWIKDKKVAVLGIGISNRPLVVWLVKRGVAVDIFDRMDDNDPYLLKAKEALGDAAAMVGWHLGEGYMEQLRGYDVIFRTPRIQPGEPSLVQARREGAILTSEMELFLSLCKAPVTAVTGSDGKTTTSSLIAEMYEAAGFRTHLGGNIGTPLLDRVETILETDRVVVELSSFQLISMSQEIDTALITNITPNHLDVHATFEEYVDAKKNIFRHQTCFDRLILNAEDAVSMTLLDEAKGQVDLIEGRERRPGYVVRRRDGFVELLDGRTKTDHVLIAESDVLLPGRFNVTNVMAAALAVWPDVSPAAIKKVAGTFCGVKHRMELVRDMGGIRWYNSSIDSTPHRSMETINVFAEQNVPLVLIAGGADKKSDYTGLGRTILSATDRIILCGANADSIRRILEEEAGGRQYLLIETKTYEEAVSEAARLAKPGDAVLLSPTGTSFDKFRHFEERGEHFRKLVKSLPVSLDQS
jgi:UDP-N-acetylmuramoylalanine--D-glutamate ligase